VSVFRELFVEVPQALLEAAVREAQERAAREHVLREMGSRPPSRTSKLITALDEPRLMRILCERYGWHTVKLIRESYTDEVLWRVRLACGHAYALKMDERVIEDASPGSLVAVLDKTWDRVQPCYCVPRSV
jgi:hypothetical protein